MRARTYPSPNMPNSQALAGKRKRELRPAAGATVRLVFIVHRSTPPPVRVQSITSSTCIVAASLVPIHPSRLWHVDHYLVSILIGPGPAFLHFRFMFLQYLTPVSHCPILP